MLLESTEDIKNYLPVNTSLEFDVISPYIKTAERDYLTKVIGSGLYAEIDAYKESAELTETEKTLLDYAKIAVINLALFEWAKTGTLQAGNMGLTMQETANQKVPYKYKEQEYKDSVKANGFNALDAMLEFLEENINTFPTFKQSVNYTVFKGHLIGRTQEFNSFYFIDSSRLVFIRMQRFIIQAEDFHILPTIGRELYDRIMSLFMYQGSGSGSGSGDYNLAFPVTDIGKLIKMLQKATAHLSVYMGVVDTNVNVTDRGWFFEGADGGSSSFASKKNVQDTSIANDNFASIARNALKNGNAYLEQARQYILKNIDSFPEYADSDAYDETVGNRAMIFDNTDKKIVRM